MCDTSKGMKRDGGGTEQNEAGLRYHLQVVLGNEAGGRRNGARTKQFYHSTCCLSIVLRALASTEMKLQGLWIKILKH